MQYSSVTHPDSNRTPQSQPLSAEQVKNNAGGFVYEISDWQILDRFLIIGAESGTYYVREATHVFENYGCLLRCLEAHPARAIDRIVEVSVKGLAVKQDPAIFALAVAAASTAPKTRELALARVNAVCRTGSTFFQFLSELKQMRNLSGRSVRRAIASWYSEKSPDALAYQLIKYRERNRWTHRDTLRLAHAKMDKHPELVRWVVKGEVPEGPVSPYLEGFLRAQRAESAAEVAKLITEYNLPREAVPTAFLPEPEVWDALLPKMPITALIRNLGNMTRIGLLETGTEATQAALKKLANGEALRRSRVHPISILTGLKAYKSGTGLRGSNTWEPVPSIVAALDDAFYTAFQNVVPTGKRILVGLDVSGSMTHYATKEPNLMPSEIGAALCMVWIATEPQCEVMGFADTFRSLGLHRRMSLGEALTATRGLTFGRTDCALPMLWAAERKTDFDAFVIVTDNETWFGDIHPKAALHAYRRERTADARQVILATAATQFSIADPNDLLAMDISGFSADVPAVIAGFLGANIERETED